MTPAVFAAARALAAHAGSGDAEAFRAEAEAVVAAVAPVLHMELVPGPPAPPQQPDPDSWEGLRIPPAREWRRNPGRAALEVLADHLDVWSVEYCAEPPVLCFYNGVDYYNLWLCDCGEPCSVDNPRVWGNGTAPGDIVLWDPYIGCKGDATATLRALQGSAEAAPTPPA